MKSGTEVDELENLFDIMMNISVGLWIYLKVLGHQVGITHEINDSKWI